MGKAAEMPPTYIIINKFDLEDTKYMNSEQLGLRLKTVREIFGLNQLYVAEKLGVPQSYISRLESGSMSSGFLISALEFYRQYISLDRLLNEKLSIMECIQEELASPTSELVNNRIILMHEKIDELFDTFKADQSTKIDEIKKRIHVKMEALNIVEIENE